MAWGLDVDFLDRDRLADRARDYGLRSAAHTPPFIKIPDGNQFVRFPALSYFSRRS
jgi:hypothetical protein